MPSCSCSCRGDGEGAAPRVGGGRGWAGGQRGQGSEGPRGEAVVVGGGVKKERGKRKGWEEVEER